MNDLDNQQRVQPSSFQRPTTAVEICSMGMITSVGGTAEETAAAVRAGISCYNESEHFNKSYSPMVMSLLPNDSLPPLSKELNKQDSLSGRQRRMLQLATPAMQQALADVPIKQTIPLMLAGPEKLPDRRSIISDKFLQQLVMQTEAPIELDNSYVFPYGRSGGFHALEAAMLLLEQNKHPYVMIGAIDTYLDLYLLGELDKQDRIHAVGVIDSFVPGEAACFIVLKKSTASSSIKIYPPGIAEETGHRYSSLPYTGDGLSTAVRNALTAVSSKNIETVIASFNGENFASKEWGVTLIRNSQSLPEVISIVHPADCFGDVGAAYGPISLALAAIGISNGYMKSPALLFGSSEMSQRAAVCVTS